MTIGQQSGKPDRASRANQAMRYSLARRNQASEAFGLVGPIRQVGQSGKSGNRAIGKTKLAYMKVRTASHFARLLTRPDWSLHDQIGRFARLVQKWVARPTHGQIGARLVLYNRASRAVGRRLARLP